MTAIVSVNVGLPKDVEWKGRTVRTAVWKDAVPGRRKVARLNIEGDGQAFAGSRWRAPGRSRLPDRFLSLLGKELGRKDFVFGQFGENFTVEGLSDEEVCIGDRYRIGSALFEVTQPRVTCYRLESEWTSRVWPPCWWSTTDPGSTSVCWKLAKSQPGMKL